MTAMLETFRRNAKHEKRLISRIMAVKAISMWHIDGCDTMDIAEALAVPEWQVYNEISSWRKTFFAEHES
jgi:hypothetical protein